MTNTETKSSVGMPNLSLDKTIDFVTSDTGLILFGCAAAMIAMKLLEDPGKDQIARSRWGGNAEKKAAKKIALKEMEERRKNKVSLYIGANPKEAQLYVTSAERGTAVIGGPGSGKTASCINPLVMSAIDQTLPIVLYDFKYPQQTSEIIGVAAQAGYKVKIFAPGFAESEVINPLDFLRDESDATMAREIASVMNRNLALASNSSEDKFFSEAGDQLVTALMMLAKSCEDPDLLTIQALLTLDELPKRLQAAAAVNKLNPWVELAFSQLFQVAGSEKTVAGIIATASKLFTRFLAPELISCFVGKTSICFKKKSQNQSEFEQGRRTNEYELKEKELLIFGLNREKREATSPLIASMLHMIINKNVVVNRTCGLALFIDELPTLFLPNITNWLNENRSDGLLTTLGFQNIGQLEKAYSKEISRAILGGTATKFYFNPQDSDSAEFYAKYLGEETITIKSKSKTTGKSGASNNISDHKYKIYLVEPAEFNRFPPGKCVYINPGYKRKNEGSVPISAFLKLDRAAASELSEAIWPKLRKKLTEKTKQKSEFDEIRKQQVEKRLAYVKEKFPLPDDSDIPPNNVKSSLHKENGLQSALDDAAEKAFGSKKN
ncbi:MAG: type IV secretory system conjugative DNA transfer family protein [Okeania sp. SIO2F4]|uniref:type IV secretory system conjugative DNA transfer family protein n=1 Tax=Okeania sp. SIO2F4 TaxID=2607790 RepID=UPI00142963DD|nr:type IV secretion system DNA-binding domain-containing protein [Okeania sp. SIO2F4]NES01774.1 type IV secretory system conjugative DNA transfer family protein [Okeania sp. SIO2F4]